METLSGFARFLLVVALFCFSRINYLAAETALEVGVLPYINMDALLETYRPLAHYLEAKLARPVRIVSARDYRALLRLTARREYPLLVTASHFGRLAQLDSGYTPILRPLTEYHEMVLVRSDGPIHHPKDLRGRVIAVPDDLAQVVMMVRRTLRRHGIAAGREVTFLQTGSHGNAVMALRSGSAAAAVVSSGAFRHMDDSLKAGLQELAPADRDDRGAIPVLYMASPNLSADEIGLYTSLISQFVNETDVGVAWIRDLGYGGLRPVSPEEMTTLDRDTHELRQILSSVEN